MWAEGIVAVTHLLWISGWWSFGHLFYLIFKYCPGDSFTRCSNNDFLGVLSLLAGSMIYFWIARHVLNFLYKGELPGPSDVSANQLKKLFSNLQTSPSSGKGKGRHQK